MKKEFSILGEVHIPGKFGQRETWQLIEAPNSTKFIQIANFWKGQDGEFHPPGKDKPRFKVTKRDVRSVIELLKKLESSLEKQEV